MSKVQEYKSKSRRFEKLAAVENDVVQKRRYQFLYNAWSNLAEVQEWIDTGSQKKTKIIGRFVSGT